MGIKQLFQEKEFVFSFEIFPPKPSTALASVYQTIEELSLLKPDYISVTYGAGGSVHNNRTCQLSHLIQTSYTTRSLAHLTCIGASKDTINHILHDLKEKGVTSILALRGDLKKVGLGEFRNSQELLRHIKAIGGFELAAACYPEGHLESGQDLVQEIRVLRLKEQAGADYFISQLFFDNNYFYDYLERAFSAGVVAPIQAGIMPVINKRQIERVVSLCGATLPSKFKKIIGRFEHDPLALREAGIAFALEQIVDLIAQGVRGIHLYTMNNPYIAQRITDNIAALVGAVNKSSVSGEASHVIA